MTDRTLVSQENIITILDQVIANIKTKITNKDISIPYTSQLTKSTFIKVDGDGSMYLSNNGNYVSLGNINKSNLDITKIYEIFNIFTQIEHWDSTGIVNMPTARDYLNSQIYNGKIYCIGGFNSGSYFNIVEIYDIASNSWTTGAPMPTARYGLTSRLYNGKIYCIGGYLISNKFTNIVEIYDIANNSWTTGTPMPTIRHGLISAIYNGKIYCIGGYTNIASNIVEIYNIANNSWTTGSPMPTPRYYLTSQIYNGKIYCIGGSTTTNKVEIYDIANNSWTTGTPMSTARYELTSQIYNGKIYCIGGHTTTAITNIVEIYDIANNSWTTGISMTTARSCLTSEINNGKIYCIGGYGTSYLNKVEIYYLRYSAYSITLPDIINNKLSKIIINGDGTKVLRNDGTYKQIVSVFNPMTTESINNYLSTL